MLDKIKRLGTETAIYGISTILGRFLTFVLTPFYTYALGAEDLGIVAYVYAYIAFMNVVYGYGMEGAYMKYVSTLEIGNRKQVFSVPFYSVLGTSSLLSAIIIVFASPIGHVIDVPAAYSHVLPYAGLILLFDSIAVIPFATIRMESRPRRFAAVKIAGITLNVILNILSLFVWQMGVEGIFLSGVVSSAATLVMLLPVVFRNLTLSLPSRLFPALLKFGLPSVPSGIAGMMIQVINRPIMNAISGPAAVGIFQANYRLGIFMMLLVAMFDFAWRPFFLSHAKDPDAKALFARVMTYVVLIMAAVLVTLTVFLGDAVRWHIFFGKSLIAPKYWVGLEIVPVILFAYVFLGIYNNLIAGIYIEKRTSLLPVVTFTAATVNIAANYGLIPIWGLMGAAIATLVSYVTMAVMLYFLVRRVYPIPYEWRRLLKITVAATVAIVGGLLIQNAPMALLWKTSALLSFPLLLYVQRFFVSGELKMLSRLSSALGVGRNGLVSPRVGEK
jgi:O-antigen/teichoic acid export membrane protein